MNEEPINPNDREPTVDELAAALRASDKRFAADKAGKTAGEPVYVLRLPESAFRYYEQRYKVYREMNVPQEEAMRAALESARPERPERQEALENVALFALQYISTRDYPFGPRIAFDTNRDMLLPLVEAVHRLRERMEPKP